MLKAEGIVLKGIRYKDTSKIITIYTKEYGKISAMANGVYRAKSQLAAATEPFSFGEFYFNKGRNFLYLNQVDIIDSFYSIRENIERVIYGSYILELVDKSLPDEQENEKIFALLEKGLKVLVNMSKDYLKFIIAYELKFVSFLGYKPNLERCTACGEKKFTNIKFSISQGGIICNNCFSVDLFALGLNQEIYETMYKLLYIPLEKVEEIQCSQETINKLHDMILEYILINIDRKKFNSLELMESLDSGN